MIGGIDDNTQLVTECLLFDNITTGQFSCKKVCVHVHALYMCMLFILNVHACTHKCMYYHYYVYLSLHLSVVIFVIKFISIISHCLQIPLPESVTGRYFHSLTAVTMSPHCVWLVIVGGSEEVVWKDVGGGVKEGMATHITDTNRLTMIIELSKNNNYQNYLIMRINYYQYIFQYILKLVSG